MTFWRDSSAATLLSYGTCGSQVPSAISQEQCILAFLVTQQPAEVHAQALPSFWCSARRNTKTDSVNARQSLPSISIPPVSCVSLILHAVQLHSCSSHSSPKSFEVPNPEPPNLSLIHISEPTRPRLI
eukprot:4420390-Amphidinium_carterae.1